MSAPKIAKTASAAEVRAWAVANGYEVGKRGRFAPTLVAEFNKAQKKARKPIYREAQHVPTVTVKAKPEKGRTVTAQVNIAQVRAAALAAGVPVGKRGRISEEVQRAYVLGTLSDLAG